MLKPPKKILFSHFLLWSGRIFLLVHLMMSPLPEGYLCNSYNLKIFMTCIPSNTNNAIHLCHVKTVIEERLITFFFLFNLKHMYVHLFALDLMVLTHCKKGIKSSWQFPDVSGCIRSLVKLVFKSRVKFLADGWSELPNLLRILANRFPRQSYVILCVSKYWALNFCRSDHRFLRAAKLYSQPSIR